MSTGPSNKRGVCLTPVFPQGFLYWISNQSPPVTTEIQRLILRVDEIEIWRNHETGRSLASNLQWFVRFDGRTCFCTPIVDDVFCFALMIFFFWSCFQYIPPMMVYFLSCEETSLGEYVFWASIEEFQIRKNHDWQGVTVPRPKITEKQNHCRQDHRCIPSNHVGSLTSGILGKEKFSVT